MCWDGCAEEFDGVFSADNLPEKPRLLVVNTDPANIGCACVWTRAMENISIRSGSRLLRISKVIWTGVARRWTFNRRQLQSVISRFRGHYCIYYCMLRCRGVDMPKIVSSFTTDTALNDVLVHGFVCRVLNKWNILFRINTNFLFQKHIYIYIYTTVMQNEKCYTTVRLLVEHVQFI